MVRTLLHLYSVSRSLSFQSFRGYYRCLTVSSWKQSQQNALSNNESNEHDKKLEDHKIWMLKLTHENSFLSWSRNAVICAGVGATLKMVDGSAQISQTLSTGFFDLGVMFMSIGAAHHVFTSFSLQRVVKTSRQGLLWIATYTTGIWLLYLLILFKIKCYS